MPNLIFRGATLDKVELRRKKNVVSCIVHFSTELSTPVMETMDWGEVPEFIESCNLSGFLSAESFKLEPADKKMKDYRIESQCSRVEAFTITRKSEDDDVITRLRFQAMVEKENAIIDLERWMRNVAGAEGQLSVLYVKQEKLPGTEGPQATDEQRAAAMEIKPEKVGKGVRAN